MWDILEPGRPGDTPSRVFDWALLTLIVLNVLAVVLESVDTLSARWGPLFNFFEGLSIGVFSLEYLGRLWSCVTDHRYAGFLRGRMRFALTPMAIVDLLAVLPAFLPMVGVDLRVLRGLRLLRLFRLLKAGRYSQAPALILKVVRAKREELTVCVSVMGVLLFVAATLAYHFEHVAQPGQFPNIPAALWWAITTMTTVGYGDVVPVTAAGKLTGGLVAVLGICFFAFPTSILGAGFLDELRHRHEPAHGQCPRCGHRF